MSARVMNIHLQDICAHSYLARLGSASLQRISTLEAAAPQIVAETSQFAAAGVAPQTWRVLLMGRD